MDNNIEDEVVNLQKPNKTYSIFQLIQNLFNSIKLAQIGDKMLGMVDYLIEG